MPSALPHRPLLVRRLAREGQHQPQAQLGGEVSDVPRAADLDAERRCGIDIDGGIPHAGRDQKAQVGEALEDGARKRRPLAHCHNRLEGGEAAYELVGVDDLAIEARNLDPARKAPPVRHLHRNAMIVVEQCEIHHAASPPAPRGAASGMAGPASCR